MSRFRKAAILAVVFGAACQVGYLATVHAQGIGEFLRLTLNGNLITASSGTATITVQNSTDTLVGRATTDTLTNKTLTTPVINGGTSSARNLVAAYASGGAITLVGGVATISGGSPSAMTLAACAAGDAGMTLIITAISAQAHTVTVTAGFNGGGGGSDVATFGGAIGDTMVIACANTVWNVVSLRNVVLS